MYCKTLSTTLVLLFVVVLSFGLGCGPNEAVVNSPPGDGEGDSTGEDGDGEGASLSIDPEVRDSNRAIFEAQCEMIFRCCTEEERTSELDIDAGSGEEQCIQNPGGLSINLWLGILSEAVAEGRIAIDPPLVQLCVDAYRAQSCNQWKHVEAADALELPGCSEMIVPLLQEGEDCAQNYECTTRFCYQAMNSDREEGTCTARGQAGSNCSQIPCGTNFYCDTFTERCAEKGRVGDSCNNNEQCRSEYCEELENNQGICRERLPICQG